eukprot:4497314-Amphidinium_carterae.1
MVSRKLGSAAFVLSMFVVADVLWTSAARTMLFWQPSGYQFRRIEPRINTCRVEDLPWNVCIVA